jgi:Tol biopolymer transport system component
LQYLAAVASTDHGNALFLLHIDAENLREIKTLSTQYIPSPSWSPGEEYISFHDTSKALDDIFLYSILDLSLQNITQTSHEKDLVYSTTNPWNEDGRYLAFTSYNGDTWATRRMGLYDAVEKRILHVSSFEDQNLFIEWGRKDIFSFQTGHSHDVVNIGIQSIDSKTRIVLISFMHNDEGKFLSHAWSPDGTWFSYVYVDNHSMFTLKLFNLEYNTCREYPIPIKTSNPISMQWYLDEPFLDVSKVINTK